MVTFCDLVEGVEYYMNCKSAKDTLILLMTLTFLIMTY